MTIDESDPLHKHEQSAAMLKDVLDGATYAAVSARWGVPRASVERRIKSLAAQLTRQVGVEGLDEGGALFVKRLRAQRDSVLLALDRLRPSNGSTHREARVLTKAEVNAGARRVRYRADRPLHDLALYWLPFATGLRPLEVARLEVADYLSEDGSVRRESVVRPEVAINGRARPLFFCHRGLDSALQAYLDERLAAGHGLGTPGVWRGLDPRSRLFLDEGGRRYVITSHGEAGQHRHVCRALLDTYRRTFRKADVPALCTQSARLTLMLRMYERGADEDQVGQVLGIADRSAVRSQLPRPRPTLVTLMEDPE